ncbi:MAG: RNA polymerase sigma factor [Lentisphaeraceae bacterium]|nr:RNA polymerase sigma factor [Lentisphaeraceae bacterium]
MMKTDEELITAYKDGDTEAFTELVKRYKNRLFTFLGGKNDAKDLVQETFKKVFNNLSKFNEKRSFKAWVFKIAKNCSIDEGRKAGSRFNLLESCELPEIEDETSFCPSASLRKAERKQIILEAVNALPEKQRQVLSLSYFEGETYPEIAKKLDCSVSSVKTHMSRAVQKLAQILPDGGRL